MKRELCAKRNGTKVLLASRRVMCQLTDIFHAKLLYLSGYVTFLNPPVKCEFFNVKYISDEVSPVICMIAAHYLS
jgi:hypothetical protein